MKVIRDLLLLVTVLVVAIGLRMALPPDDQVAFREDLGSGTRALYATFMKTKVLRVANVQDLFVMKLGTLGEQKVILLPFTEGWYAL